MSQNHLKIEPPEIENPYYGCQNSRTRRHSQGETPEEVSFVLVAGMLEHLTEQCLALTFKEKKKKLKEINLKWEHGEDIRVFLSNVQKLQETLEDEYGIEWPEDMRKTHVVA